MGVHRIRLMQVDVARRVQGTHCLVIPGTQRHDEVFHQIMTTVTDTHHFLVVVKRFGQHSTRPKLVGAIAANQKTAITTMMWLGKHRERDLTQGAGIGGRIRGMQRLALPNGWSETLT